MVGMRGELRVGSVTGYPDSMQTVTRPRFLLSEVWGHARCSGQGGRGGMQGRVNNWWSP